MPSISTFPFLDLPKEIRLMIYEYLPLKIRHTHSCFTIKNEEKESFVVTAAYYTTPSNIRRTCSKINAEVCDVFQHRTETYYRRSYPLIHNITLFCREISEPLWLRVVYIVAHPNNIWMPTPCDSILEAVETVRRRTIECWNRGLCPFDEMRNGCTAWQDARS